MRARVAPAGLDRRPTRASTASGCGSRAIRAERARRVAGRDGGSHDDALAANAGREASEAARYLAYYGIDIGDLAVYDLVLDSTASVVADLVEASRRPRSPEG